MSSKKSNSLSTEALRHAEYYNMQPTFDKLYAESKNKKVHENLMDIILSKENILLAYRNIKSNKGSETPGTDGRIISNIGCLTTEEVVEKVRFIIRGTKHGYRPKPVRRVEIPKPNGKTRPLGIPCIWDRIIQQCIKQVLEPICEAKFSDNSYGFRPNRSAENAIAKWERYIQCNKLKFVIEFDIEGFFDNVSHSKLIKQMWALGIHDKEVLFVVKRMLKAPIKLPNGEILIPSKGTPQGGICSPLFANIVLNELDHWVESQWQENPVVYKYQLQFNSNGTLNHGHGYRAMRSTKLKEVFIVRYADDFRIFSRNRNEAERMLVATTEWLDKRLHLNVSRDKTRIVNVNKHYTEFLGFKTKTKKRRKTVVINTHISDKALSVQKTKLVEQAKNIAKPRIGRFEADEIRLYNSMVLGIQNYYKIASNISIDCRYLNRAVMTVLTNRLRVQCKERLVTTGRPLTKTERELFGNTKMMRFVAGSKEPIYPIGFTKYKIPSNKRVAVNCYTEEGRAEIHNELSTHRWMIIGVMKQKSFGRSVEYMDNRISHLTAQHGRCYVTGIAFNSIDEIHCHHLLPKTKGGNDSYNNLVIIREDIHVLIHAHDEEMVKESLKAYSLTQKQREKFNKLRQLAGNCPI